MGLNQIQLNQHIDQIIQSRRILNKIVILCEGDIQPVQGHPSPQRYRQLENYDDAKFYKKCVPTFWRQNLPQFFNCGGRQDVLNVYTGLLRRHQQAPDNSYLTPQKLFALVDLDLQRAILDFGYQFLDTEQIFHALYQAGKLKDEDLSQHHIWVTGLIHKESYFFLRQLQSLFDEHLIKPFYQNRPLLLENVYAALAQGIESDEDLKNTLSYAKERIKFCQLEFANCLALKNSWQQKYAKATEEFEKNQLITALLMVCKSKTQWKQIEPDPGESWPKSASAFRDQLMLAIAKHISSGDCGTEHHLYKFFKHLYQFA